MCIDCMQRYLILYGALSLLNINCGEPSLLHFYCLDLVNGKTLQTQSVLVTERCLLCIAKVGDI